LPCQVVTLNGHDIKAILASPIKTINSKKKRRILAAETKII
jgi:hypothetical protein